MSGGEAISPKIYMYLSSHGTSAVDSWAVGLNTPYSTLSHTGEDIEHPTATPQNTICKYLEAVCCTVDIKL